MNISTIYKFEIHFWTYWEWTYWYKYNITILFRRALKQSTIKQNRLHRNQIEWEKDMSPIMSPILFLCSHFFALALSASGVNTYSGHSKVWICCIFACTSTEENFSIWELPSASYVTWFMMFTTIIIGYCQRNSWTASGHLALACNNVILAISAHPELTILPSHFRVHRQ